MSKSNDKQNTPASGGEISRRDLLKLGGVASAVALVPAEAALAGGKSSLLKGKKLAMVIDLQRCTGCGGCIISCISENNVQAGVTWAKKESKTLGTFPNVRLEFLPTLCNHCHEAPCVRGCPTGAMHKADGDTTAHDPNKCIGCKTCKAMCPYDVITINTTETHRFWRDNKSLIEGCTASGKEVVDKVGGDVIPHYNRDKEKTYSNAALRHKGVPEKCTFCDHRTVDGLLPFCVNSCPANARIFGDLNDPKSEVSTLVGKYQAMRLKEHLGTEPKIYYIRSFNPGNYPSTKGSV